MAIAKIFDKARQTPGKTAVVYNGVACSYGRFAQCIEVSRQYLAQQQIPADSVAVIAAQAALLDGWVLGLALRSLGLTTLAARNDDEIAKLGAARVGCVVIAAPPGGADLAQRAADSSWRIIRIPPEVSLAAKHCAIPAVTATNARPGGHIMMTSGTTGVYKMVVRDAAMEELAIPLHAEINGITEQSIVYVSNFGLWTAGGYRWPLITWSTGGTVVIHEARDRHSPLARHDLTHMFSTPGMLATLLHASGGKLRRNDSMRLLVTGGALTQALLAAAKRDVTQQVFSVLAATEVLTLAVTPLDHPADLLWHRIHPSREVQVVDEAGNVLGPGTEGLIRVRIIDGLTGYLDDETTTREFFRDGFFYPGDLGQFGPDGRLSMRGRASDVINVLGDKIATGPVERALQERLGVEGACIVSIQNTAGEDEIYLVIQSARPIKTARIAAAGGDELAAIRRAPVRVVFRDKLPRNEMGKIQRLVLKQQLLTPRTGG
jgi:acyl-coenzyme A synthetase/AMP-(fatty) acid ligase